MARAFTWMWLIAATISTMPKSLWTGYERTANNGLSRASINEPDEADGRGLQVHEHGVLGRRPVVQPQTGLGHGGDATTSAAFTITVTITAPPPNQHPVLVPKRTGSPPRASTSLGGTVRRTTGRRVRFGDNLIRTKAIAIGTFPTVCT